jgi:8-oxo-dGTP pyrophosphatase MutT (NUDIX family)
VIVLRAGDPFEILMVRRNDTVAFMAGSYVFPGGRVDDGDHPAADARLPRATFRDLSDAEEAAYRAAAVRELEDEANVRITIDDLQPFAHWVTPEIEIRRYDTRFFLARMPTGKSPLRRKRDDGARMADAGEAIGRSIDEAPAAADPHQHPAGRAADLIDDVFTWAMRPIASVMPILQERRGRDADPAW